jgi:hypothetical protein
MRDAAATGDLRYPFHSEQALGDGVVHEPGQRLRGHRARAHCVRDDRSAVDILTLHDRFLDTGGEVDPHLGNRIAHVGYGAVDGRADVELHEDARLALERERGDVVDVAHTGHGSLDLLHDLGLDLLRRGTGLEHLYQYHREGNVRVERHRQSHECDHAEEQQHREKDDRRDGVANRPGRDVLHGRR